MSFRRASAMQASASVSHIFRGTSTELPQRLPSRNNFQFWHEITPGRGKKSFRVWWTWNLGGHQAFACHHGKPPGFWHEAGTESHISHQGLRMKQTGLSASRTFLSPFLLMGWNLFWVKPFKTGPWSVEVPLLGSCCPKLALACCLPGA